MFHDTNLAALLISCSIEYCMPGTWGGGAPAEYIRSSTYNTEHKHNVNSICLVQVQLRTEDPAFAPSRSNTGEVLHTPSSTQPKIKLMTYRSQHIHVTNMPALTIRPSVTNQLYYTCM